MSSGKAKRKNDTLYYHLIKSQYKEAFFFDLQGEKRIVRRFEEVLRQLDNQGITHHSVKRDKGELYRLIYHTDKRQYPLVRLRQGVQRRGQHKNDFMSIYKYLLRGKQVDLGKLTEALLIALGIGKVKDVSFGGRSGKEELERVEKQAQGIKLLEANKARYDKLVSDYDTYQRLGRQLARAYAAFCAYFPTASAKEDLRIQELEKAMEEHAAALEKVKNSISEKEKESGVIEERKRRDKQALKKVVETLTQIASYDSPLKRSVLEDRIKTLEEEKVRLRARQAHVTTEQEVDDQKLAQQVKQLQEEVANLKQRIGSFDDWLIHHLSLDQSVRQKLQGILSQALCQASKAALEGAVTTTSDRLFLFDGVVNLSEVDLTTKSLDDLQALKKSHTEKEQALEDYCLLQADKKALAKVTQQLEEQQELFRQFEAKPRLEQEREALNRACIARDQALEECTTVLATYRTKQKEHEDQRTKQQEQRDLHKQTLAKYRDWEVALRTHSIPASDAPSVEEAGKELFELYQAVRDCIKQHQALNNPLQANFSTLTTAFSYLGEDIDMFITEKRKAYDVLPRAKTSLLELMKGALNDFRMPIQTLLDGYEKLTGRLKVFNRALGKHSISNLKKIALVIRPAEHCIKALKAITTISTDAQTLLFEDSHAKEEGMYYLRKYLEEQRTITFTQLFAFELEITDEQGKKKTTNMKGRLHSQGTDKLIRLFLFLKMLTQMVDTKDHPLVVVIDEASTVDHRNLQATCQMCEENGVLPIFANPDFLPCEQIQYKYLLTPDTDGKVRLIDAASLEKLEK